MKNIKSYMYAVQSWRMVTFSFVGGAPDIQTFMVHLFGLGMQLFVCLSFWPSVYARVGFSAAVSMNGCWSRTREIILAIPLMGFLFTT